MVWLRQLFWLAARFNFHLTAQHLKGKDNIISDKISRMDDFVESECKDFLKMYDLDTAFEKHMSKETMCLLFQMWSGIHSNNKF